MSSSSEGAHLQDGGEVAQQWTKTGPIAVSMAPDDVRHLQGTQEVTAAEPAPLGLLGLATGTIAIGYVLSGSTAMAAQIGTAPVLLVFAGIALFVAGLWRSRKDIPSPRPRSVVTERTTPSSGLAALKLNPVFVGISALLAFTRRARRWSTASLVGWCRH